MSILGQTLLGTVNSSVGPEPPLFRHSEISRAIEDMPGLPKLEDNIRVLRTAVRPAGNTPSSCHPDVSLWHGGSSTLTCQNHTESPICIPPAMPMTVTSRKAVGWGEGWLPVMSAR